MCGIVLVKWARVCACHIIHLHASKHTMRQWTMAPIKPSILIPYFAFLSLEMRDERTSHILPSLSCLRAPYTHLCPRRHSRHFISSFRLLFYFNCYVRASATHTNTHKRMPLEKPNGKRKEENITKENTENTERTWKTWAKRQRLNWLFLLFFSCPRPLKLMFSFSPENRNKCACTSA